MPDTALHETVVRALTDVLGPCMAEEGRGRVWAIIAPPRAGNKGKPLVVLITGAPRPVSVWVLDPRNRFDGVHIHALLGEGDIPGMIEQVLEVVHSWPVPSAPGA